MFLGLAVVDPPQPGLSRAYGLRFFPFPILSGAGALFPANEFAA